jgi:DNA-binding NarL/FixJ family response regulator
MIRVLLIDDHSLFREGLSAVLGLEKDIEVVAQASDGLEAIAKLDLRPEVALVDLEMPRLDGAGFTERAKRVLPELRVVALTTFDDEVRLRRFFGAGGDGYLLKGTRGPDLTAAIRQVAAGEMVLEQALVKKVIAEMLRHHESPPKEELGELSERELAVLTLVTRGAANREIASALFISEGTVKNHLTSIFKKLGVSDRTQAALLASRHGLR